MDNQRVQDLGELGLLGMGPAIAGALMVGSAIAATAIATGVLANEPMVARTAPLIAQVPNCRKVVAEGRTPFFTSLPQPGSTSGVLQQGDRVELLDGGTTYRGRDGQIYLRVASPYNSANPTLGYVPYRYTPSGGGSRSTLGYCGISGRW